MSEMSLETKKRMIWKDNNNTVSVFCSCFEGTVIVHYCGRNKPWKNKYIGALDIFYEDAEAYLNSLR